MTPVSVCIHKTAAYLFRYPVLVRQNMLDRVRPWLPEILLGLAFLYLALRKLGSFPDAWQDDSLFMIVARNFAEGHGYMLPVLKDQWINPYILQVGPNVIMPSALFIWLFGFSVAVARIPMVLYLAAAVAAFFFYSKRFQSLNAARWATALLISFSAFINTGKPVLGEVPAFLFLILGLIALDRKKKRTSSALAGGIAFGLSVVSKITFGLIYPALGLAWIVAICKKEWKEVRFLTVVGLTSILTFVAFSPLLGYWDPGFIGEMKQYAFAGGGTGVFQVLRTQPGLLLRFQYLYFGLTLALGSIGLWNFRKRLGRTTIIILFTIIIGCVLYFLNERGYFRHVLLAHLLLITFVPAGIVAVTNKKIAVFVLSFFVAAQGWWQVTYQGSRLSPEAKEASVALQEQFKDRPLVITQPEIYVRVMGNPLWQFLSEELQIRDYPRFADLPIQQDQHCLPILRKISDTEAQNYKGRLTPVSGRYMLIEPELTCTPHTP